MAKDFMVKESELDDIQMKVLNSVLDKNIVVSGCAGSGKSLIALRKAQRVQSEAKGSCEVIVFTKALCGFMNSGRNELGLKCPFFYHWQWKNKFDMPKADYVIVDEIQDFTEEEIQEFMDAARKHFFFFGDTAQSIYQDYKPTVPVENLRYIAAAYGSCKEFPLYSNYRLPKPVAKITQDYIGVDVEPYGDGSVYRSKENVKPKFLKYPTLKDQMNAIVRIIKDRELTDAAILVPHNDDIPQMLDLLKSASNAITSNKGKSMLDFEVKYNDKEDWHNSQETLNFATNNPKVMTFHSAKGLQFETVFIPDVAETYSDGDRKALYVAMTRTYRNLYVMYSGVLPDILKQVRTDLYETTETDEIEDL